MKKALFLLIAALLMAHSAQAQLTHNGIRFGLGAAYVADDFLTSSPIMGGDLGVFVNYGFENAQAFWADNLYLQLGFNFTRRGTNFKDIRPLERSYRHGYFHNYYAEIPILAAWRWELPIAQPEHYLNFYAGPVVSLGLFGTYKDRKVTPGMPQSTANYDTFLSSNKNDRRSFQHLRRIDASLQLGVGYKHNNLAFDLFWQHGFVPLMNVDDVLRTLAIEQNGGSTTVTNDDNTTTTLSNRNSYTGTSEAFILCVSYIMPMQ